MSFNIANVKPSEPNVDEDFHISPIKAGKNEAERRDKIVS